MCLVLLCYAELISGQETCGSITNKQQSNTNAFQAGLKITLNDFGGLKFSFIPFKERIIPFGEKKKKQTSDCKTSSKLNNHKQISIIPTLTFAVAIDLSQPW